MKIPVSTWLFTCSGVFILFVPVTPQALEPDTGIKHIVFCWLYDPGRAEDVERVIRTSRELGAIPGVVDIQAGKALPSDRSIVDDSFDVGVTMTFKNTADMNNYLAHDEHTSRVNQVLRPLCRRILVYDIAY